MRLVPLPRPALYAIYGLVALMGVTLWTLPSDALTRTIGHIIPDILGGLLTAAALAAGAGLIAQVRALEAWGVVIAALVLLAYAIAPIQLLVRGDAGLLRVSVLALTVSMMVVGRAVTLLARSPS